MRDIKGATCVGWGGGSGVKKGDCFEFKNFSEVFLHFFPPQRERGEKRKEEEEKHKAASKNKKSFARQTRFLPLSSSVSPPGKFPRGKGKKRIPPSLNDNFWCGETRSENGKSPPSGEELVELLALRSGLSFFSSLQDHPSRVRTNVNFFVALIVFFFFDAGSCCCCLLACSPTLSSL